MNLRLVALIAFVCIQVGCGSMEPIPGDTFYRLKQSPLAANTAVSRSWTPNTLVVERFHANGIYKDRAIALLQQDGVSLSQSKYHYWNDSPEILLQERFLEFARTRNLAGKVSMHNSADAKYRVSGRILRFERVRTAANSYEVSIRLELSVRHAAGKRESLFQEQFTFLQAVPGEQMPDTVALFSEGLEQLFSQFINKASNVIHQLPQ